MAYTPYYAPYSRPMGYYNPSIPQENPNIQGGQQFQQMPVQQPVQQMPMQTPTPFIQTQPTNDMLFVLNENEARHTPLLRTILSCCGIKTTKHSILRRQMHRVFRQCKYMILHNALKMPQNRPQNTFVNAVMILYQKAN